MMSSAMLSACDQETAGHGADKPAKPMLQGTTRALTMYGYNYTDKYIDDYSVNGQGGGNLFISGPTSGGGGSMCCVDYTAGYVNKVKVRWQFDACMYDEGRDSTGKMYQNIHSFYREVEVTVDANVAKDPHYFEVHFYPEGHVEARITEESSMPLLVLSEDRRNKSGYPRCPDGKKPKK